MGTETMSRSRSMDDLVRGAIFAGLGELVLRTETAAMVAAAIILHRLGAIG